MPLIDAFTTGWQRSFDYSGRTQRGDYWWFVLANLLVALILRTISDKLYSLYAVASILPGLPLAIRRLRDIGKSWTWLFISLIPIIGSIWLIVLFCQPSISG